MGVEQGRCDQRAELAMAAAVVVDPRLADVWEIVWTSLLDAYDPSDPSDPGVPLETIGALLRLAYVQGYADAADEPVPGLLYSELGVRKAQVIRPTSARPRRGSGRAPPGNSGR